MLCNAPTEIGSWASCRAVWIAGENVGGARSSQMHAVLTTAVQLIIVFGCNYQIAPKLKVR